jgi:hypothetical protein
MPSRKDFYVALYTLHERLLVGDPTVLGDVAQLVFGPLIAHLRKDFSGEDDHMLQEKAADALLEYGRAPAQAGAESGAGVLGFLVLRARSRVLSALRREQRREVAEGRYAHDLGPTRRKGSANPVELRRAHGEHHSESVGETSPRFTEPADEALERQARVDDVLAGATDERDRQILQLMLDGVRATEVYARALGIEDRPVEEQRRIVKQHKDRLKVAGIRRQEIKRTGRPRRGRPPRPRGAGDSGE